jgi:transcriptional regulator GlxA family with amidase domain
MRSVAFLIYDGLQALDLVAPWEAFFEANRLDPDGGYALSAVSLGGRPVNAETGLTLAADAALETAGPFHTVIVPGGIGVRRADRDPRLVAGLQRLAADADRVVSICTGAWLVAEAGLADGRRMTTHWRYADDLAAAYPAVRVDAERLYMSDGRLWSAAGVMAGLDLALAMIEQDLGETAAVTIARYLVVYLRRSGSQSQFSAPLRVQGHTSSRLARLADWLRENPGAGSDTEALAAHAGFSPRHFRRILRREAGASPAEFVEGVRLDTARDLLAAGRGSVKEIAVATGFNSADVFRRAFRRRYLLSPTVYRERFRLAAPEA